MTEPRIARPSQLIGSGSQDPLARAQITALTEIVSDNSAEIEALAGGNPSPNADDYSQLPPA